MDTQEIFKQGGLMVPNPNYNPKSKKNKEPAYIHSMDVGQDPGAATAQPFTSAASDMWTMGDTRSYQRYDVTPNKVTDMDTERAENQSALSKFGHALAQTVVSEVGLGSVIGVTDLFDFIGSKILGIGDDNYQNPVSKYLTDLQDKFNNEVTPIYAKPGVDISNGGLFDAGWWASNIPSIASSLTLLLPAAAGTKGLQLLAKLGTESKNLAAGTRAAVRALSKHLPNKEIGRWMNKRSVIDRANMFLENGMTAALSRTMENYQEGRGVYNDMYAEASEKLNGMSDAEYKTFVNNNPETLQGVDTSDKDAVAKAVAKQAADVDFKGNYVNGINDIIELYALRNAFGSGMLSDIGRASVRKAQRESLKYAGKTAAEIAKAEAARPFLSKAGQKVGDLMFGSKLAVGAQLGEGVEEAVNYVMQEEGMHTGRHILGTEPETSFWDDRLKSYVRSPQLWESAFWGVLGGVVFQAGGSYLKRVQQTLEDKQKAKKNKPNEETKESTPEVGWRSLSELPEVQRRVKDIESRAQKAQVWADQLADIEKGNHPFKEGVKLTNEIEKEAARRLVRKNATLDITMSALNNGNFDLTKEYFADDNVRKAMVEKGIITEAKSKEWQQEVLTDMDKIKENYEDELARMDDLSVDYKGKLPVEFLQIAATDNIYHRMNVDTLTAQQNDYLEEYRKAKQRAIDEGKLDETLDYDGNIRLQMQVGTLYKLYAQKRELEAKQKKKPTLVNEISLANLNKNIKTQQKKLYDTTRGITTTDTLFALGNIYSNKKSFNEIDSEIESVIDEAVDKGTFRGFEKFLGLDENSVGDITNADELTEFKKKYLDRGKGFKAAMDAIQSIGESSNNYRNAIELEHIIDYEKNSIVSTKDEFNQYMTNANNTLTEMRKTAITDSYDTLRNLAKKYGPDVIDPYVKSAVDNEKADTKLLDSLEDKDKDELINAVKVLNFSNTANKPLYTGIAAMFDAIKYKPRSEESSTTSNSSISEPESEETNNQSGEPTEPPTAQGNTPTANVAQPQQQPQKVIGAVPLTITTDGKVDIGGINPNGNVMLLEGETDGLYELDIAGSSLANDASVRTNKDLFDVTDDASPMDDNAVIIKNPILANDGSKYTIVDKGLIGKQDGNQQSAAKTAPEPQGATPLEEAVTAKTGVPAPTTSSTGRQGSEATATTQAQPTAPVLSMDDVRINIAREFGKHLNPMNEDLGNVDDAKIAVKEALKDSGIDEETLNKEVDARAAIIQTAHDKLMQMKKGLPEATAGLVSAAAYESRYLEPETAVNTGNLFTNTFKAFCDQYVQTQLVPKIDGKYLINLSDILRLCTQNYANKQEIAQSVYSQIRDYLLSDLGKAEFVVLDEDAVVSGRAVRDALKTTEELAKEQTGIYSTRVNIQDFIEAATATDNTEYFAALRELQTGDEVQLYAEEKELIIKDNKGRTLGNMPRPHIEGNSYIVYNENWRTDVSTDGKGNYRSQITDLLRGFFTKKGKNYDSLRDIIVKAFLQRNQAIDKSLISQFENHPLISSLIGTEVDSIARVSKKANERAQDVERLLKHLAKLYGYVNSSATKMTADENRKAVDVALNRWTDKLFNSYETISNIKENTPITVGYINEGQINRVTNDFAGNTVDNYDKLPHINDPKAIAPDFKDEVRIGIVTDSIMNISGQNDTDSLGWKNGSTVISVISRNTQPDYVKAIGLKVNADEFSYSPPLKEMYDAVIDHYREALEDFVKTKDTNKLADTLRSIFADDKTNYISLFRPAIGGFIVNSNENAVEVTYQQGTRDKKFYNLQIWAKSKHGSYGVFDTLSGKKGTFNTQTTPDSVIVKEGIAGLERFIKQFGTVNISALGVQTDNAPSTPHNGFFSRVDAKLQLNIPSKANSYSQTFNDYNDFIVKNNLVRVNTYVGSNGSNFVSRGTDQRANQQLFVDLPTSKVKKASQPKSLISENSNAKTYDDVQSIINSDEEHKGQAILDRVLGEAAKNYREKVGDIANELFPDAIIYDENLNYGNDEGAIAESAARQGDNHYYSHENRIKDKRVKTPISYGTVVVGTKFLNFIASNNNTTRKYAINRLIHEQIHIKLGEDDATRHRLLSEIGSIYDEFRSVFNPRFKELKEGDKDFKVYSHINSLFHQYELQLAKANKSGKTNSINSARERLYEEFLTESLTNTTLANYLNSIVDDSITDNKSKDTFLTKVAKFIAKIFGINIKDNSLYMKELNVIRDIFNIKPEERNEEIKEAPTKVEEPTGKTEEREVEIKEAPKKKGLGAFGKNRRKLAPIENETFKATEIEPVIPSNNTSVSDINSFVARLPMSAREDVKNLVNDGYISMKCSI